MAKSAFDLKNLIQEFVELYGGSKEDISVFFAPGRVNLIGEHTDYNGGFVLPCSLHYGTFLLVRKVNYSKTRFRSKNLNEVAEVDCSKPVIPIGNFWVNYPLGVISEFQKSGLTIPGFDFLFAGNIPNSAGLSSSASIEMVTAFALNELGGYGLSMLDLVKLCQRAENDFVGMKCGIMDMFSVGLGKKDHAIFLNCDNLQYELVPVILGDDCLVITNTNKQRRLAGSKYNERRAECELAVNDLQSYRPIKNLSELDLSEFNTVAGRIKGDVVRKRALHVISENQRVIEAVKVLKHNDVQYFGELMYESHRSLKEDYEVSCFELDTLVEEASKIEGVAGSRMTGAGFGGCTVSIVRNEQVENFIEKTGKTYKQKTGLEASFFIAKIEDGVRRVIK